MQLVVVKFDNVVRLWCGKGHDASVARRNERYPVHPEARCLHLMRNDGVRPYRTATDIHRVVEFGKIKHRPSVGKHLIVAFYLHVDLVPSYLTIGDRPQLPHY